MYKTQIQRLKKVYKIIKEKSTINIHTKQHAIIACQDVMKSFCPFRYCVTERRQTRTNG